jgi:hypothetical protein
MAITAVFVISPCTSIPRLKAPPVGMLLFRAQVIFPGLKLENSSKTQIAYININFTHD